MKETVLETFGVSKRYRNGALAVDRVSLRVARGEIYGFLGLNGAGKSTLIRMLLAIARPTSGSLELFGERVSVRSTGLWRRVGHLVDRASAYPELSVRENLEVARRLQGIEDDASVSRVIEEMGLEPYAERRAGQLSQGNLQRLALARALLHRPELLILDEPTSHLDPGAVVRLREHLWRLAREEGVTVFLSSHDLGEVERMASRIGFLHRGRLVEEFKPRVGGGQRLQVGVRQADEAMAVLMRAGFSAVAVEDELLELGEGRATERPEEVTRALALAGIYPWRLQPLDDDLEHRFLRITEREEP